MFLNVPYYDLAQDIQNLVTNMHTSNPPSYILRVKTKYLGVRLRSTVKFSVRHIVVAY